MSGTPTNTYRFGSTHAGWVGQAHQRQYDTFEADSPEEAWDIGRRRWFYAGPRAGDATVGLERYYTFPATHVIGSPAHTIDFWDKRPQRKHWVRVAAGSAEYRWDGSLQGGVSILVTEESKMYPSLWSGGAEELMAQITAVVKDRKVIHEAFLQAPKAPPPADFPLTLLWISFTETTSADDWKSTISVGAPYELWVQAYPLIKGSSNVTDLGDAR